jgi:hypothetical protein
MGRISCNRCTSYVATTASGRIMAAYRLRLLASSSTAISRSAFWYSNPIDESEVLAIADAVGSSP